MSYSENITKIIESILSQVSYLVKRAKFDKTFKAKVIGKVSEGKYQVLYKGKKYYVTCKTSLSTNNIVKVCAPQNNWSELFVVNDSTGSIGGSIIAGVSGIKGNAETAYRDGNVNITPANIGLGNVDNIADENKSVLSATKLTTPRKINDVPFDGTQDIRITDSHIPVTKSEYKDMIANNTIDEDSYYLITDDEENILTDGIIPDGNTVIVDDAGKLCANNANDAKKLGGQLPNYYAKENDVVKISNISNIHTDDKTKVPSSALVNDMNNTIEQLNSNINNKISAIYDPVTTINDLLNLNSSYNMPILVQIPYNSPIAPDENTTFTFTVKDWALAISMSGKLYMACILNPQWTLVNQ